MLEESRIELNYKTKDLNQRIMSQAMHPLICLDNVNKITEAIKKPQNFTSNSKSSIDSSELQALG